MLSCTPCIALHASLMLSQHKATNFCVYMCDPLQVPWTLVPTPSTPTRARRSALAVLCLCMPTTVRTSRYVCVHVCTRGHAIPSFRTRTAGCQAWGQLSGRRRTGAVAKACMSLSSSVCVYVCPFMQVARTGDIVAIGGLKDVVTGETLCDEKAPIILERMDFPDPVIKIAIEPKSKVSHTCYAHMRTHRRTPPSLYAHRLAPCAPCARTVSLACLCPCAPHHVRP